jgi:hypothetical protein
MGLGGILQELKTEGVLALYHDYRSGRLVDYSGNGRNGINASGVSFTKKGLQFNTTGAVVEVADDATLRGLTGCLVARFSLGQSSLCAIASKYLNPNYQFYWLCSGTTLTFTDAAAPTPTLATTLVYATTHAVNFSDGSIPVGYVNGNLLGNYSTTWTSAAVATNLKIGNFGTVNSQIGQNLEYFLWFSRQLTATEHSRLYGDLENMTWNTKGLAPGSMMP